MVVEAIQLDSNFVAETLPSLNPEESYAYGFFSKKGLLPEVKVIGQVDVRWCSSMGEHGVSKSEDVSVTNKKNQVSVASVSSTPFNYLKSNSVIEKHINNISVVALSYPSSSILGSDFPVTFRVTNNISHSVVAQLQFRISPNSALMVFGVSYINLPPLDAGEYTDITCTVLSTNCGFQDFGGVVVVDLATRVEFPTDNIFKIMIYTSESSIDNKIN